jgi:hypothetical protein
LGQDDNQLVNEFRKRIDGPESYLTGRRRNRVSPFTRRPTVILFQFLEQSVANLVGICRQLIERVGGSFAAGIVIFILESASPVGCPLDGGAKIVGTIRFAIKHFLLFEMPVFRLVLLTSIAAASVRVLVLLVLSNANDGLRHYG